MMLILGLIVCLTSTYIGYILSLKYTEKKDFFYDFLQFNKRHGENISLSNKTVYSLIKEYNDCEFIKQFNNYLSKKDKYNFDLKQFSNDEKNFVVEYFFNVGKNERKREIEFNSIYDKKIDEYYKNAITEEKKYKNLYIKLGLMIGLIFLIIIV